MKKKKWVVVNSRGEIMNDMMGRVGYSTKKRADDVANLWRGKVVTMYMLALGEEKLSEKTWKKIAKVNQLVLDK